MRFCIGPSYLLSPFSGAGAVAMVQMSVSVFVLMVVVAALAEVGLAVVAAVNVVATMCLVPRGPMGGGACGWCVDNTYKHVWPVFVLGIANGQALHPTP